MKPKIAYISGLILVLAAEFWSSSTNAAVDVSKLPPPVNRTVEFTRDIFPIFETSCLKCHGPERPKGRFRLDNQEMAFKGGANGIDIHPGESLKSPLLHYVAGLDPEMLMPPEGKGDPLTTEQVALLRAWIDQGASWGNASVETNRLEFSFSPVIRYFAVSGDERAFSEHQYIRPGVHYGVEDVYLKQKKSPDTTVTAEGSFLPRDEEYRFRMTLEKQDFGFVQGGFEHWRKYYDDSGGYYPPFSPSIYSLDRDLYLKQGRAWIDFGLTMPDLPRIVLGYEYQFKDGAKSTLQWGETGSAPSADDGRNIYPAYKMIDEKVHIFKFDLSHELYGFGLSDTFRAEFYELRNLRANALFVPSGQTKPETLAIIREEHDHFQGANTFRIDRTLNDWAYVSGGYLYTFTDADAVLRQGTFNSYGSTTNGDFWGSQGIVLSQNSHVLNLNGRLGPWDDLTISAGVVSEFMHQEGLGRVSFDVGDPAVGLFMAPAQIDANLRKASLGENLIIRYGKIPFTVLYAEARLKQERYDQYEEQVGGFHDFARNTEASVQNQDYRAGFTVSPWQRVSLNAQYRRAERLSDYDHVRDSKFGFSPGVGYPAFILSREMMTDEAELKLSLKPASWLKTSIGYKIVTTDYENVTSAVPGLSQGGDVFAGNFDAHVYSAGVTLTPWRRWYLSTSGTIYDSRISTFQNGVGSMVPYKGQIYSGLVSATYLVDEKTDLTGNYYFSRSDYGQNNFAAGLPVGLDYERHGLMAGVTKRFKKVTANLQYGWFHYREASSGYQNDYDAHAVFATLTYRWP